MPLSFAVCRYFDKQANNLLWSILSTFQAGKRGTFRFVSELVIRIHTHTHSNSHEMFCAKVVRFTLWFFLLAVLGVTKRRQANAHTDKHTLAQRRICDDHISIISTGPGIRLEIRDTYLLCSTRLDAVHQHLVCIQPFGYTAHAYRDRNRCWLTLSQCNVQIPNIRLEQFSLIC